MSAHSKIEWTDATWNPLRGCSRVSEGCTNCYAERVAARFSGPGMPYEGLIHPSTKGWSGNVHFVNSVLGQPMGWKKPRRIFVNSMSDLFHEHVGEHDIDLIFAVMASAPQHTFQVLTKRPERAAEYLNDRWRLEKIYDVWFSVNSGPREVQDWPLPNVWLGASVEDQKTANERIPLLVQCPAAVRWLSCEPLLGPIDLERPRPGPDLQQAAGTSICQPWLIQSGIDWVVVGGESGPGARPMHPDWAGSLRDQCASAGVPYFFKQWGEWAPIDSWQPWHRKPQIAIRADGSSMPDEEWHDDGCRFKKIGKRAAGRLLDGVEHNAFPEQRA